MKLPALLVLGALVAQSPFVTAAESKSAPVTVVFVHGAFADGTSWVPVISELSAKNVSAVAVQNPLSSLADDVAAATRAIELAPGNVVLVGHSWGGAVISQAGNHPKVKALVYVAAFAPDSNQSVNETQAGLPPPPWLSQLVPDSGGFVRLTPQAVIDHFAPDLILAQRKMIAATQGPIFGKAFDDKVTHAAWADKKNWYIVASQDHMIDPGLQAKFAAKMKAKVTTVAASHVVMISQPKPVAAAILEAVAAAQ